MLSFEIYKNFHLAALVAMSVALGAATLVATQGDARNSPWRKTISITHGVALLVMLVSGFGMLARLQVPWPWPGWVWGKAMIWLCFGALTVLIKRMPQKAVLFWWVIIILAFIAAYLAINKPF